MHPLSKFEQDLLHDSLNILKDLTARLPFLMEDLNLFIKDVQKRSKRFKDETSPLEVQHLRMEVWEKIIGVLNSIIEGTSHTALIEISEILISEMGRFNDAFSKSFSVSCLPIFLQHARCIVQKFGTLLQMVQQFRSETISPISADGVVTQISFPIIGEAKDILIEILWYQERQEALSKFQMEILPMKTEGLMNRTHPDLVFLCHFYTERKLKDGLERFLSKTRTEYEERDALIQHLKHFFGRGFSSAIRWMRNIEALQAWIKRIGVELAKEGDSKLTPYQLLLFLNQGKKDFFRQYFASQRSENIVLFLQKKIEKENASKEALVLKLRLERKELRLRITELEKNLQSNLSFFQNLMNHLKMIITEHPECYLGRNTAKALSDLALKTGTFKTPMDPSYQRGTEEAMGVSFLIISCLTANWVGYPHEMISALTRMGTANISLQFQWGDYLDWVSQSVGIPLIERLESICPEKMAPFFEGCENAIRWDEYGVIQKQSGIEYVLGLGVFLGMNGFQNPGVLVGAYLTANTLGYVSMKLVEKWVAKVTKEVSFQNYARLIAHIVGYSVGNRLGFWAGSQMFFSPPKKEMSDREALDLLDLTEGASYNEQVSRLREKMAKVHKDKCKTLECEEQWDQLTHVKEHLIKKRQ